MKKSKFTDQQITFTLKQAETGTPIEEVCRKLGISQQALIAGTKKLAGLGTEELRRLKQLEEENKRLKSLVADLSLGKQILQNVLSNKFRGLLDFVNGSRESILRPAVNILAVFAMPCPTSSCPTSY